MMNKQSVAQAVILLIVKLFEANCTNVHFYLIYKNSRLCTSTKYAQAFYGMVSGGKKYIYIFTDGSFDSSQITQHKWAWPFMNPVDVEGLGLHDYYQVIDRPMDFNTIKNQMEANGGTGYKHVREICADVRLVFKNAMRYNEERSDVHVMAKTLMAKFEEKWLQLLPKVAEEEKRLEEEEKEAQEYMQLAQEAAQARTARELSCELYEVEMHLEQLRNAVMQNCRKISNEEKRKLGAALAQLSAEDLDKALEIVAQNNPSFQSKAEIVNLEIDAQSESTLWRLRFFVKEVMEGQGKSSASIGGNNATINNNNLSNNNSKRKREITDAIAKTTKKKSKKPSS